MLCHHRRLASAPTRSNTRELRAYAVDEVKRTNGQVSFENAVRSQRRIEPDDIHGPNRTDFPTKGGQNAASWPSAHAMSPPVPA